MMLAAYLRGLLKPSLAYGVRSYIFEDVLLEGMSAEISADSFCANASADAALATILTDEGKRSALRRTQRQLRRSVALRLMDIYELSSGKRDRNNSSISLLQLFRLAQREGIIHPGSAK